MRNATNRQQSRRPQQSPPGDWGLNDRVRHPFFGDDLVVGIRDQGILDINFGGTRRSIKSVVVAMERV